MSRKIIFMLASALVFFALDSTWVIPFLFANLPSTFSWFLASTLVGCEISALVAEWYLLDRKLIGIL